MRGLMSETSQVVAGNVGVEEAGNVGVEVAFLEVAVEGFVAETLEES